MEKNNQYLGTEPLGKLLFKLAVDLQPPHKILINIPETTVVFIAEHISGHLDQNL